MLWSNTEPAWNATYAGWYNGSDRCIFAARTNGTPDDILEFFHENDYVAFATMISDRSLTDLDDTWTDVILTIPIFTTMAYNQFSSDYVNISNIGFWRTNGQTDTTGHTLYRMAANSTYYDVHCRTITDSAGIIEVKHFYAGDETMEVLTHGWFFPIGF